MPISVMTVSIPVDVDTLEEIHSLINESSIVDNIEYTSLLSIDELNDFHLKGFCVLAYDDESDQLVSVLTAVDRIATLDFEWSMVVLPSVRKQGIGELLFQEFTRNFVLRGGEAELALTAEDATEGKRFLEKHGYVHDFSERTMIAKAEATTVSSEIEIAPYKSEEAELIEVLTNAFGDTEEEARELIAFNTITPNRCLITARLDQTIVGTVSLVEDTDKLWITGLAVHEQARGKGVASAILDWSKNEAFRSGKTSIYLDVETDNDNALSLYKKAGFNIISHTNFYKKG